jgi:hypothetical protein
VTYIITGRGLEDVPLYYEKETLAKAGYLASKMFDNGVRDVCIRDPHGDEVSFEVAYQAFRADPPPGWIIR